MLTVTIVAVVVIVVAFAGLCAWAGMIAMSDMDRDSRTGRPDA